MFGIKTTCDYHSNIFFFSTSNQLIQIKSTKVEKHLYIAVHNCDSIYL